MENYYFISDQDFNRDITFFIFSNPFFNFLKRWSLWSFLNLYFLGILYNKDYHQTYRLQLMLQDNICRNIQSFWDFQEFPNNGFGTKCYHQGIQQPNLWANDNSKYYSGIEFVGLFRFYNFTEIACNGWKIVSLWKRIWYYHQGK